MTQPISITAIETKTSKPWSEWVKLIDDFGGRNKPHKEIAAWLVSEQGQDSWWAQSITVAYEQHIGRREPGQTTSGYQVAVSKTVDGSLDDGLAWWCDRANDQTAFNGVEVMEEPRISESDNYRYWRAQLADGSRLVVGISKKSDGKVVVAVQHEKLTDASAVEQWRDYWKAFIA